MLANPKVVAVIHNSRVYSKFENHLAKKFNLEKVVNLNLFIKLNLQMDWMNLKV